jgi:hypothetical protein
MDAKRRKTAKLLAAVIGGSAVVTMGALTMAIHQQPGAPDNVAVGQMTMGPTSTAAGKPATVEATSVAVPSIKGPAPLPPEEAAAQ